MPTPIPLSFTPAIDCHAQAKAAAEQLPSDKKKIFVFCDGTGNQFAKERKDKDANSNVVKLYGTLLIDGIRQVGYYHPGVGTMGDPTAHNKVSEAWSVVKGLAFGAGLLANVGDAYRYLMDVYKNGDQIMAV